MRRAWFLVLLAACAEDSNEPAREGTDAVAADGQADGPAADGRAADVGADGAADTVLADGAVDAEPIDGATPDGAAADGGEPDVQPPPAGCLDAVVRYAGVEIFQYEASRPDATADSAGADESAACSRAGVLPWTFLTIGEARAACQSSGFELCHGTQWQAVCAGDPPERPWPYGHGYQASVCNDHINGAGALEPTGAREGCRTPQGVYDLSGNVWEFTDEGDKRGASYKLNAVMFRQEVTSCLQTYSVLDFFEDDDVGFRCCRAAP